MHFLLAMLALVLPTGLETDDTISMEDGVEYLGAQIPEEVAAGEDAQVDLYFQVEEQLPQNVSVFLHIESPTSDCRVVRDRKPTGYEDGVLAHSVTFRTPESGECGPQRMDIYAGLYEVDTGHRYEVHGLSVPDNRLPAGSFELVAAGSAASTEVQTFAPSDIAWLQLEQRIHPWRGWLAGLALSIALLFVLRWLVRRRGATGDDAEDGKPAPLGGWTDEIEVRSWPNYVGVAVVAGVAIASILAALDFVKDDAYISFRYAHNLVEGHGLVFNPGERIEGFTNFLWTLLIAPFEAMGLDLFQVLEILGTGLVLGVLLYMVLASAHLMGGARRDMSHFWAPLWIATSSSVALWSTSGMEQPLAMFLPVAGAYLLWTSWDDDESHKRMAASGVLIGLGCLTRPEIHLIGIILGLPLVVRVVRERRFNSPAVFWFAGLLGITAPAHLFRYIYYGSLFPNTFYVKTGGSTAVLLAGLQKLHSMYAFNAIGALALLSPLSLLGGERRREKIQMLCIAGGFMAYVVYVGNDEMRWHRLYLPALPFLALLATDGLRNVCRAVVELAGAAGWKRYVVYLVGWAVVIGGAWTNFSYTYEQMNGFNGRGPLSGNFHPDLGKFLTRHAAPGSLVAFQDMGSTPYHAPDLKFLDFVGLVDETVAHARHDHGLHAFVSTGDGEAKAAYNAEMREYFYERSPEWVILTSYIPGSRTGQVADEFAQNPHPTVLEPWIGTNTYQFDIYNDRFKEDYAHVRTWPRSATYYLSVFQRRDLREQVPREVVIGEKGQREVGEELGGETATFEGGLELLGSHVEQQAVEKREFYVTTRWLLPGAMSEDVFFFLHVERPGFRNPEDHVPGDWMYPANRWEQGQILEDRVLFQVPPVMSPGRYEVYLGVYNRRTGERLKLVEGEGDGSNRMKLGDVEIREFRPLLDQIIVPTRLDEQRKYPSRLVGEDP
ncbi:MAG: glycosyltransferase family 87 protein [Myxococcota bacterium]